MENFLIVLFKNKKKKKVIKGYATKKTAIDKFKKLIDESNSIVFDIKYENAEQSKYELLILSKDTKQEDLYYKDEIGRFNKVFIDGDTNYSILKISDYKVEELIYDCQKMSRITFSEFVKSYLSDNSLKVLSLLNNKVVLQHDDVFKLFSLKNKSDAERLLSVTEKEFMNIGKNNCLFIYDDSITYKKWMYDVLEKNGYNKNRLYRQSINFSKKI